MSQGVEDEVLPYDGSRYERWHLPVPHYGPDETNLGRQLEESDVLSSMTISREEWNQTTNLVDEVLQLILEHIKKEATQKYGLVLHGYARQGSSREGLTAGPQNDFDVILKFSFKGLTFEIVAVRHNGKIVAEFAEIQLSESLLEFKARFPTLDRRYVFLQRAGKVLLRSRALEENVFAQLLDRATQKINASEQGMQYNVSIKTITCPNIKIRIEVKGTHRVIDVDIVPGLVNSEYTEDVHNPKLSGASENGLPLYGIVNWHPRDRNIVPSYKHPDSMWLLGTVSYEFYLLDTSRHNDTRNFIIMALRILKAYFRKTNLRYEEAETEQSPLTGLLTSYHLKQVAFYCIQYLDIEKKRPLRGVREALGYVVDPLEVSLQERHLQHFFDGNTGLRGVIPGFVPDEDVICFDIYADMTDDALRQARMTLDKVLREDLRTFIEEGSLRDLLMTKLREYIHSKTYLQKPSS